MINKFHHITTDLEHDGYFYPRIPQETFHFENKTTSRTCVSTTEMGCLSAFPYITDLVDEKAFYIKVFDIIPSEIGITEEDILTPHFLYEKGYLHDALITDEYWITKAFSVPAHRQKIHKVAWVETTSHLALPFVLMNEIKEKYKSEIEKEAEDKDNISFFDVKVFAEFHLQEKCKKYHEEIMNVMTVYDYYLDEEMKDEVQEIYFSKPYLDELKDFIYKKYPNAKMIESWRDECCFEFPPRTNLKDIYLYDYGLKKQNSLLSY